MPIPLVIDVSELKAAQRSIRRAAARLSAQQFQRVHEVAATAVLEPLVPAIRARTPVRSGDLRRSVGVVTGDHQGSPSAIVGYRIRRGGGVSASQALGSEFGNIRNPAPPRVVQTVASERAEQIEDDYHQQIEDTLTKELARR